VVKADVVGKKEEEEKKMTEKNTSAIWGLRGTTSLLSISFKQVNEGMYKGLDEMGWVK